CFHLSALVFSAISFSVFNDPIMVAPGTDVILPCRLEFEMDLVNKTIEWRGIQITAMMMQSYIQRTSMFYDRLRRGDMSLKIMNVTFEDNGIYECSLPRRQQRAKVQLVVSEFQFSSVGGPSLADLIISPLLTLVTMEMLSLHCFMFTSLVKCHCNWIMTDMLIGSNVLFLAR
uniref:Ig-like domain-containing protein n=1 Tax=Oryzias melastigma TaxID=30732 RepID=A0A3B3E1T4_ORYME